VLTIGIIVEGVFDAAALPELIRKCCTDDIHIETRVCRSASQLMQKGLSFLEGFRYVVQGLPVDKALIIRDADGKDPNELVHRLNVTINTRSYPFPVTPVIIVQELETWLLADSEALSQVTGKSISEITESLETLIAPKQRLQNLLSEARVPYTSIVVRASGSFVKHSGVAKSVPFETDHRFFTTLAEAPVITTSPQSNSIFSNMLAEIMRS
jgi:hypothetical protein